MALSMSTICGAMRDVEKSARKAVVLFWCHRIRKYNTCEFGE